MKSWAKKVKIEIDCSSYVKNYDTSKVSLWFKDGSVGNLANCNISWTCFARRDDVSRKWVVISFGFLRLAKERNERIKLTKSFATLKKRVWRGGQWWNSVVFNLAALLTRGLRPRKPRKIISSLIIPTRAWIFQRKSRVENGKFVNSRRGSSYCSSFNWF